MTIRVQDYKTVTDDLAVGQTARVNHDSCTAGADHRRRLYLTRTVANPDAIVAYCHNCQQSGYHKTGTHVDYRTDRHQQKIPTVHTIVDSIAPPTNMVHGMEDWPVSCQAWAANNGISPMRATTWLIAYDPTTDRVFIPRYDWQDGTSIGKLMGYQLRNCDPDKITPKYLTTTRSADKGFTVLSTPNFTGVYDAVIVEDFVSAIHIVEACMRFSIPVKVFVNYGTKVNLELCHAAAQFDTVITWLDNDSPHVIEQAQHIHRTVCMIEPQYHRRIVTDRADPKHYTRHGILKEMAIG